MRPGPARHGGHTELQLCAPVAFTLRPEAELRSATPMWTRVACGTARCSGQRARKAGVGRGKTEHSGGDVSHHHFCFAFVFI